MSVDPKDSKNKSPSLYTKRSKQQDSKNKSPSLDTKLSKQFFLSIIKGDYDSVQKALKSINKPGVKETIKFKYVAMGRIDLFPPLVFSAARLKIELFKKIFNLFTSTGFSELNEKSDYGISSIEASLISGKLETAEFLFEKGANLMDRCKLGHTSLMHVSQMGKVKSLKWVYEKLKYKSPDDDDVCHTHGNTALLMAVLGKRFENVKFLLSKGANITIANKFGTTPLLLASFVGGLDIMKYLLTVGSNLKEKNFSGNTALHLACKSGRFEIVKWLCENTKIDLQTKNNAGKTCYAVAAEKQQKNVEEYLLSNYGENFKTKVGQIYFSSWGDVFQMYGDPVFDGEKVGSESGKMKRYEIDSHLVTLNDEIARGTFGVVFRGSLKVGEGEIDIAVKELIKSNENDFEELKKEIDIMANLKHENCIKYFGFFLGKNRNKFSIVMELAENGTLYGAKMKLNRITKMNILLQIAKGMSYLHAMDIVHRDLKPSNVLLSGTNTAKICDFGTSKHSFSVQNTFCGTAEYISPEMCKENVDYDAKLCDVYAFGLLCWEVLSNKVPYAELKKKCNYNQIILIKKIHEQKLRPDLGMIHDGVRGKCTDDLIDLVEACWCQIPQERPQSFKEIVNVLQDNLKNEKKMLKKLVKQIEKKL